jgi:hypothetical protein
VVGSKEGSFDIKVNGNTARVPCEGAFFWAKDDRAERLKSAIKMVFNKNFIALGFGEGLKK